MGFFSKTNCAICGKEIGAITRSPYKIEDQYICGPCSIKLEKRGLTFSNKDQFTIAGAKAMLQEQEEKIKAFNGDIKIVDFVYFDTKAQKFALPKKSLLGKVKDLDIYDYEDLIDFELLEDGDSQLKGGVGRAAVGGALFGGVGAIVGASTRHKAKKTCTYLQIKLTLKDLECPTAYIDFINTETKKDGLIYKTMFHSAQEAMSAFNVVCQTVRESQAELENQTGGGMDQGETMPSAADEIMKFKNLCDQGIISEEEFEAKKKQLLGL